MKHLTKEVKDDGCAGCLEEGNYELVKELQGPSLLHELILAAVEAVGCWLLEDKPWAVCPERETTEEAAG